MGELNIKRRKDTKKENWYYEFEGKPHNGKRNRITKSGFKSRSEANQAGMKAYNEYWNQGVNLTVGKCTFKQYLNERWWPYITNRCLESTLDGYKKIIYRYLMPRFRDTKMNEFTIEEIQKFFWDLYLNSSTAHTTVDKVFKLMGQIFNFAEQQKHLDLNPMKSVNKPNKRKQATVAKRQQVRRDIQAETLDKIYARFPEGASGFLPLKLAEVCGLRKGEAFGLAWEDVDFEQHVIYVTRQLELIPKSHEFSGRELLLIKNNPKLKDSKFLTRNPKYESKRVVLMTKELEDLLYREKERQEENKRILGESYIQYYYTKATDPNFATRTFDSFNTKKHVSFQPEEEFENGIVNTLGVGYPIHFINVRQTGEIINPDITKHISRVIRGCEGTETIYKDFNFHSLRNTYASNMRAEGYPQELISATMGHKKKVTTEGYMNITKNQLFENINRRYDGSGMQNIMNIINENKFTAEQKRMLIEKLSD